MPNINLLQDSAADPEKKPKKAPKIVFYTNPAVERPEKPAEPKLKRSFFGRVFKSDPVAAPVEPLRESVSGAPTPTADAKTVEQAPIRAFRTGTPMEEAEKPKKGIFGGLGWSRSSVKPDSPVVTPPKRTAFSQAIEESEAPSAPVNPPAASPAPAARPAMPKATLPKATPPKLKKLAASEAELGSTPEARSGGFDVNLLPGDLIGALEPKPKVLTFIIVAVVAVALVAGGYGGLVWYEQRIFDKVEETDRQIENVEKTISGLRKEQAEALVLKSQTDQIKDVLDHHVYWRDFFTELEKFTLPEVSYEQFAGSFTRGINPTFTLSARCDSFDTIAKQLIIFQEAVADKEFITNVIINSGEVVFAEDGSTGYTRFNVQLTVMEDVFFRTGESSTD